MKLGNNKFYFFLYLKWVSFYVFFFVILFIDLIFVCVGWIGVEKGDDNIIDIVMFFYYFFFLK